MHRIRSFVRGEKTARDSLRRRRRLLTSSENSTTDSTTDYFNAEEYMEYRRKERSKKRQIIGLMWQRLRTGSRAERIDFISRGLFPLGFIGFNCVYWLIMLPKMS